MKLVVDTNVLFSFFQKTSETRKLILNFEIFDLHAPSFSVEELKKHRKLICEKAKVSKKEFEEVLEDLLLFLQVVPSSEYKDGEGGQRQGKARKYKTTGNGTSGWVHLSQRSPGVLLFPLLRREQ